MDVVVFIPLNFTFLAKLKPKSVSQYLSTRKKELPNVTAYILLFSLLLYSTISTALGDDVISLIGIAKISEIQLHETFLEFC